MKTLNQFIVPLNLKNPDYNVLLSKIGDARFVLMGEASHGTHEFYKIRADITKQLIMEKDFTAIAIEGDWPDAYRVNRYVKTTANCSKKAADEALNGFKRFPTWMWRNRDILDFINWLCDYNQQIKDIAKKIGFYGLDLYSLHSSMAAVIKYLERVDPEAAQRARERYSCFDRIGPDPQRYGYLASINMEASCTKQVIEELIELQQKAFAYVKADNSAHADEYFYALQNARLVKDAERYYRSMFTGRISSWNLRDSHMVETINDLAEHLKKRLNQPAKIIVWAHNSHVGDARATDAGKNGEHNIGQLLREQYPSETFLIGFSTYTGTVTAASDWDMPAELKKVTPALKESYEALFHTSNADNFILPLAKTAELTTVLQQPRLQRAIGVIYRPDTERASHYYYTQLTNQFDAIIHIDKTRAVIPLEINPEWGSGDLPETFPEGI